MAAEKDASNAALPGAAIALLVLCPCGFALLPALGAVAVATPLIWWGFGATGMAGLLVLVVIVSLMRRRLQPEPYCDPSSLSGAGMIEQ